MSIAETHILTFCIAMACVTCIPLLSLLFLPESWTGMKFDTETETDTGENDAL